MEVDFYLLASYQEKKNHLKALVQEALLKEKKLVILCRDREEAFDLDEDLWREDFLPHCLSSAPEALFAPIILVGAPERSPRCHWLLNLSVTGQIDKPHGCERIIEWVYQDDPFCREMKRLHYRQYQETGHSPQMKTTI